MPKKEASKMPIFWHIKCLNWHFTVMKWTPRQRLVFKGVLEVIKIFNVTDKQMQIA